MNNVTNNVSNMSRQQKIKIAGLIGGLLVILGVFCPFRSILGYKESLWGAESPFRFLLLIAAAGTIVVYWLETKFEFAYAAAGAVLMVAISTVIGNEGFDYLSIGYWFLLLGGVVTAVVTFIQINNVVKAPKILTSIITPRQQPTTGVVCKECGAPQAQATDLFCNKCGKKF